LPFLFEPIMEEFGWSREQVTLLASAKFATGAIFAILAGRFIDTLGVRKILILVSAAGGLAMVSFLWTPNLTFYYLSGILLGVTPPGVIIAVKVLISRAFHASQGTAMGAVMLATSISSMVVPIVISMLIADMGWRFVIAILSLGIWCVVLPLLIFACDDESLASPVQQDDAVDSQAIKFSWRVLGVLTRKRDFWLIGFAVLIVGFVDQAFMQHQVLYLSMDLEMTPAVVAGVVSAIGAVGIIGRLLVGVVFDKASTKGVSLMYLVLGAGCLLALSLVSPYLLAIFVVLRAVGHSAVLLDTTVLTKHHFGLANIGVLLGIFTAMVNIGFALGPWVVARMYDATGSYTAPFVLCAVLAVLAAALLLPVRPRYWLEMRARLRSERAAENG